jgi:hypothetical protein
MAGLEKVTADRGMRVVARAMTTEPSAAVLPIARKAVMLTTAARPMGQLTFSVRLRLIAAQDGGKRSPIRSDYRPDWDLGASWEGKPTLNGGRVFLHVRQEIAPGEEGLASIEPLAPEFWNGVQIGAVLPMHEGPRVVGYATVIAVSKG